jgi:hypothetical protein
VHEFDSVWKHPRSQGFDFILSLQIFNAAIVESSILVSVCQPTAFVKENAHYILAGGLCSLNNHQTRFTISRFSIDLAMDCSVSLRALVSILSSTGASDDGVLEMTSRHSSTALKALT